MTFIPIFHKLLKKTNHAGKTKGAVPDLQTQQNGVIESGPSPKQGDLMDIQKFLELTKKLDKKKKGKQEELERLKKLFERFHLLNRNYLDKEAFEKAQDSIASMAEMIANTIQYLDAEIARLRSKRLKLPFENVTLSEMQKVQNRNEMLLREYSAEVPK